MKKGITNGKLSEFSRDLPFKTPDGYFDQLDERIREGVRASETHKSTIRSGGDLVNIGWLSGVAAAIIALLILLPVIFKEETPELQKNDDLALLLEAEIYDLDGYEIEYALLEQETTMEEEEAEYREEVIQYLLDEEIELDLIVNEL